MHVSSQDKEIMTEGMACTFSNPVTFARVYVPAVRKEAYTNMSDANHGKEEEAIKPKFDIRQDFNAYLQKTADVYEKPTSYLEGKVTASEVLEEKCRMDGVLQQVQNISTQRNTDASMN